MTTLTQEQVGALMNEAADKLAELQDKNSRLVETLQWVRRNYASGSTAEINAMIDNALKLANS